MWQSKKIHCMVKSTMATETLALVDAAEISYWLSNLISELLSYNQDVKIHLPIACFTQDDSCMIHCSICPVFGKVLRVERGILREMIEKKGNTFCKFEITSDKKIANCLTKCGASPDLLRKVLGCCKM